MAEPESPSFDLVAATVGRTDELERFFASLDRQTHRRFRVLLVDQNADERLAPFVRSGVERLRSKPGLSRARNVALPHVDADVVGFPDDDCVYPDDLLERVARRFLAEPRLDGLTGRDDSAAPWPSDLTILTRDNLWNRAISFTIFLRSGLVARVGPFDERLGLPSSSGEEIDYLIRAVDAGARIEYDPTLVVAHRPTARSLVELGARDGASIGYILRKHRYPSRSVARMLLRPAGGAMLAMLQRDRARARFHLATLRGRAAGYSRDAATA
jgi:glycosyltransferase involved in cell wall biosynthesis